MIKSVSRSTGLSSVCLIILIVPLIQCSSIGNEESSVGRFKRSTFTDIGSQASAEAKATAGSFVVPLEYLEKGGKPGGWPGAGGKPGGWPGAGDKPGGWPGAGSWPGAGGKTGGWPGAGDKPGGWPGAGSWPGAGGWPKPGGWEGWGAGGWEKKEGSFGKIISDLIPKVDKAAVPFEKLLTYDALKPVAGIVDGATSALFGGLSKGFGGKGNFEKGFSGRGSFEPEFIPMNSEFFTTYLASQQGGKSGNEPNGASISVE